MIKHKDPLFFILLIISNFICILSNAQPDFPKRSISKFTRLAYQYDIKFYHFDLNLETTNKNVSGHVKIKALVKASYLDTFVIELHKNHNIDSIIINGKRNSGFTRSGSEVYVKLQNTFTSGNIINVDFYYHGTAPGTSNGWGEGLCNRNDPYNNQSYTFTLSCPFYAHEWFPCKQDLNDLIDSVEMFVTTDTSNKVASNGLLLKVSNMGKGKHRFEWKTRYPINYYLIFVSVGKYVILNSSVSIPGAPQPLLLQYFVYPGMQNDPDIISVLNYTGDFLINYSAKFGIYPFINEKFGVCIAPIGGGMEHQTMPMLGTLGGTIEKGLHAHEMAHQWFGDGVNLANFHDVWLSEGFATYMNYLTYEKLFPLEKSALLNTIRENAFQNLKGNIYADDTSSFGNIYNKELVYSKAAIMLHMIRYELSIDTMFFNIHKEYFQKYTSKNVTQLHFKSYLELSSGIDFTTFFNQWYYGFGYPKIQVYWNQVGSKTVVKLVQTTSGNTLLFKTHADIKFKTDKGDTTIRISMDTNTQIYYFNIPGIIDSLKFDPESWILVKLLSTTKDPKLSFHDPVQPDHKIKIFPNPLRKILYYDIAGIDKNNIINLVIRDINGKSVLCKNFHNKNGNLDISILKNGIYLLEISSTDFLYKEKITVLK